MEGYGAETYGDRWAEVYDEVHEEPADAGATTAAVGVLAGLARGGRVLELGVGTGRLALPLAERGLEVHGIDASAQMLELLRAKPGGDRVTASLGDLADVDVDGEFDLIFVAFNTLFALTSQEEQIRCFDNVARRMTADGMFVVEAFVPDLARFDRGQTVRASRVETDEIALEVTRHDRATQTLKSQHVVITEAATRLLPVHIRYSWPSELDLMARLAGLHLQDRWSGWDRSPFTSASGEHVSVYTRPS